MKLFSAIGFIAPLLLISTFIFGQQEGGTDYRLLYRKEFSVFAEIHTGGFGIGYRNGKNKNYFRKFLWEIEGINLKHPKEIRSASYYLPTKSFIYGKLNQCYILRGGVGQQHLLNEKPYWGGVELRFFYVGGLSLAITKPIYIQIVKYNETTGTSYLETERFDPDKHNITDIYSKASFFKGFDGLGFYPGIYFKTGLNFEYSSGSKTLKALECGIFVDVFYKNVPIIAFRKDQFIFTNLYISFHLGRKKL